MAINLKRTGALHTEGVKMLVYGAAGVGKTSLVKTLPDVIVLSAEGGLLSIQDANLPYLEISDMESLKEAYTWLNESAEANDFKSVALGCEMNVPDNADDMGMPSPMAQPQAAQPVQDVEARVRS